MEHIRITFLFKYIPQKPGKGDLFGDVLKAKKIYLFMGDEELKMCITIKTYLSELEIVC